MAITHLAQGLLMKWIIGLAQQENMLYGTYTQVPVIFGSLEQLVKLDHLHVTCTP